MIKFKYYKTLAKFNTDSANISNDDIIFIEDDLSLRTHGKKFGGSTVSVSSSNNTATWGSEVTVGTVGGTDLKFTMPSNPGGPDGNTQYYLTLNGSTNGTASTTNLGTIYAPITAGTSGYYLKSSGSGAPTWSAFPSSLPASDVYSWAKASSKPSYSYSEISGTPTIPTNTNQLTNGAGFISSVPTDYKKSYASVVSVSANTANVTCPSTLGDGDECTVIYANSGSTSDYSVTVSTDYVTPDGAQLDLTCPKSGYCEVNYLKIGSTIYARGV